MEDIEFLASINAETIMAELLTFLADADIDSDIDITKQFTDFVKEDLSRADD